MDHCASLIQTQYRKYKENQQYKNNGFGYLDSKKVKQVQYDLDTAIALAEMKQKLEPNQTQEKNIKQPFLKRREVYDPKKAIKASKKLSRQKSCCKELPNKDGINKEQTMIRSEERRVGKE